MALQFFSGGDKLSIASVHGVHPEEVRKSKWFVVDAIHLSPELDILYPTCNNKQLKIALGFKKKSSINIDNCAGAIDVILIWIHKPSKSDIKDVGIIPKKIYCRRKKEFGLSGYAGCV